MTDRELLTLAARAAGIEWQSYHMSRGLCLADPKQGMVITQMWNPLVSDADALRLAVTLRLTIAPQPDDAVEVWSSEDSSDFCAVEMYGTGPCAATRRAIVRAAAEIGRNMK